jgi:acyl-coenzyme A synthetase/AMP-(fatty) acid ligase
MLLSHPNILDISVVGVEDPEWGQRIGAVIVLKDKVNVKEKLHRYIEIFYLLFNEFKIF